MRISKVSPAIAGAILAGVITLAPAAALAQTRAGLNYAAIQITDRDLGGGVHMLFGAGGNMALLVTDQGSILVDTEYPQLSEKIKAKIAALSPKPLRLVIDTHFHWDHVGGNLGIMDTGATILASPQTLRRFAEAYKSTTKHPGQYGYDPSVLPTVEVTGSTKIRLGGETVEIIPLKHAHTDGDLAVRFVNANVLATGDTIVKGFYSMTDIGHGGSIDQQIANCKDLYALADDQTKIIPGHGPLVDKTYIKALQGMLQTARDRTAAAIKAGMTVDQFNATNPLADLNAQWEGHELMKAPDFVRNIYNDLSAKTP
jgi:glyoxylase-like metal-dependent hydrolase (beta-lactamase superfamily II)